ncbi:MAG TPA: 50S ribosomal protein L11 [Candidatus Paceibacterota bacterium]|jgi:large subunit ribosomal protein L11|nr:50S ribosomal protein L11 [Candidatus Paceibacterota bacterium]HQB56953.1 50S ribosomal protein L11 [Candidatus Paceibacterota bacterium]
MAKAKKILKYVKVEIEAGKATPAPPLGPALGQAGVQIGDFVNKFNADTKEMQGRLPVKIYVYEDRTYDYVIKSPTASYLIKKAAGVDKGSVKPKLSKAGQISKDKIREIAEVKMKDLTANTVEEAMKIIEGSAKSMGLEVK